MTDADGKTIQSGYFWTYGVTAKQKTLNLEAGATVNAPDLFNISQWKSVIGYTSQLFNTTGTWVSSDPNDLHINFPVAGTYTVSAGYYRTDDATMAMVPELSDTVTVNVTVSNTPLSIDSSPTDTTWKVGQTHNLTVKLSGGKPPYSYQWETSTDGQTWQNVTEVAGHISETTTSAMHVAGVLATDAGHYRCKVSDAGGIILTTPAFILTVQ